MKNLVSRNPIQRFKQERKIVKARQGITVAYRNNKWILHNPSVGHQEYVTPEKIVPQKDGRIIAKINGQWYNQNGQIITNFAGTPSNNMPNGAYFEEKDSQGNIIGKGRWQNGKKVYITSPEIKNNSNIKPSINKYNTPTFRGVKVGGKVKDFSNAITENQKNQLINSKAFKNDDFKDTMSFQNALNRYLGKDGFGSVKEDGLWGNQTQNAFELALKKSQAPIVNTTQSMIIQEDKPTFAPKIEPKIDTANINIPKQITRSGNFDKSQIRGMIKKEGFNPYDYTGEQRRALRLYLNGQSNDTSLLDGTDLARFTVPFRKKGGLLLPSRNPVKRFKSQRKGL